MIWLSADWHLGHNNIISYCKRPFSDIREMQEVIIQNHNKMVAKDDIVYFLGDYTFHHHPAWFTGLFNGRFIFVKGNHDTGPFFKGMPEGLLLRRSGLNLHFVHDPKYSNLGNIDVTFCGHVHEKWRTKENGHLFINVGVDVWDFKPVSLVSLMEKILKGKKI